MPSRLILNADDFGLTLGVNRAIRELHQAGVLTSATLMANSAAFDDAVAIALANPTLGVGCHVVLTDGMPISHPSSISSLMGSDGKHFRPSLAAFVQALLRGRIDERHIEREARAQIQKLQHAGLNVTHVDTHKHTHLFPAVARPLLRVAESCSISAIRNPFEPAWCANLSHAPLIRRLQLRALNRSAGAFFAQPQIREAHVHSSDGSLGIAATGTLDAPTLGQILATLPDGFWELVCHPGYNDADLATITTRLRAHRDIEREALLSEIPRRLAQPNAPQLIHYGSLSSL